jgi:hypothetical protein
LPGSLPGHPSTQCHHRAQPNSQRAGMSQLAGKLEVTNWQSSFECGLRCSVLVSTYPMAAVGTGVGRGNGRPVPPAQAAPPSPRLLPPARVAPSPPHMRGWSRRHPLGVVGEPAAGRIPSVLPVGGCSRLGASFRPQIRRWDRHRCHMVDFWVTGRPRQKSVECIRCDFLRSGCD